MKQLVGLDIGANSIKAMELRLTSKGVEVINFGYGLLSRESIVEGEIIDANLIESTISSIFANRKIKNKNVSIPISGRHLINKTVQIDATGKDKVVASLGWELPNYIPFEPSDIYSDYAILGESAGKTDVLIVAAKREIVNARVNLLKSLGLSPMVVDTSALAIQNVYETLVAPTSGTVLFADIGSEKTSLNITVDGIPKFIREINYGGRHYTDAIAKGLGMNFDTADRVKLGKESANVDIRPFVDEVNTNIGNEIMRSIDYVKMNTQVVINRVVITGGGSLTLGLSDSLSSLLNVDIELFNPVKYMKAPPALMGDLEQLGPALTVVVGLAMRKVK